VKPVEEKIVGVIGGLGPEATVDLMRRVIEATPARDDADHIRMIVDNNPKIPSRIKALVEGTGESPAPLMTEMARRLAAFGADFLVIPCNTAHFYYNDICAGVEIPILNMVDLTVESVLKENPFVQTVGLLASDAVLLTKLYLKRFADRGVKQIHPSAELQNRIMASIRKIKAGKYQKENKRVLQSAAEELMNRKAEALIVACTELSIISDSIDVEVPIYDASQVLAEGIVRIVKGELL
jgi:aspartate racemase